MYRGLRRGRRQSWCKSVPPSFAARHSAPLPLREGKLRLRVVVDRSSVTVFAGDNEVVLTDQVFPSAGSDGVALFAEGGHARLEQLKVWPLKSIWARR